MANFSDLLSKPLDDVARPPALPAGTYYGAIKNYELLESSEKKTPFVRFNCSISHAGDEVDPSDLVGIDLNKKSLRVDFYLTPDAEWRLKEFLEALGFDTKGRTFASILPDTVNSPIMMDVISRPNTRTPTDPPFNEVRSASAPT